MQDEPELEVDHGSVPVRPAHRRKLQHRLLMALGGNCFFPRTRLTGVQKGVPMRIYYTNDNLHAYRYRNRETVPLDSLFLCIQNGSGMESSDVDNIMYYVYSIYNTML